MTPAQRQRLATRLIETIGEAGDLSVALGPGPAGSYVVEVLDLAVAPSRLVAVGEGPTYWTAVARAVSALLDGFGAAVVDAAVAATSGLCAWPDWLDPLVDAVDDYVESDPTPDPTVARCHGCISDECLDPDYIPPCEVAHVGGAR